MTRLLWYSLPSVHAPHIRRWSAEHEHYQYFLTYDPESNVWSAAVKHRGVWGKHIDLGHKHATRALAVAACEEHADYLERLTGTAGRR